MTVNKKHMIFLNHQQELNCPALMCPATLFKQFIVAVLTQVRETEKKTISQKANCFILVNINTLCSYLKLCSFWSVLVTSFLLITPWSSPSSTKTIKLL